MKRLLIILTIIAGFFACQDNHTGFLEVQNASYEVDSLYIELDTAAVINPMLANFLNMGFTYEQILTWGPPYNTAPLYVENPNIEKWNRKIPWISTEISGILGTAPIRLSISDVKTINGNSDKLLEQVYLRGNGVFEVPIDHSIPPGKYLISIKAKNEGNEAYIEDIFTIIIAPEKED